MSLSYPGRNRTEDRVEYWSRQLEYATRYYKPYFDAANVLIKQYNMDAASLRETLKEAEVSKNIDPGHRIKANIVYGWISQSVANIAAHDPKFRVLPFNKEGVGSETSVSRISDYWYRETGQLEQDRRVLLDAFLSPFGCAKIGWTTDIDGLVDRIVNFDPQNVIDDPLTENDFLRVGQPTRVMPDQLHDQHIESHIRQLQTPDLPRTIQILLEDHIEEHNRQSNRGDPNRNTSIKWEAPFGQRWEPGSVLIDPLAQNGITDARWVAFRYKKPIDEMLMDQTLQNIEGLEPTERMQGAPESKNLDLKDDFGLVVGWEIWARNFPVDIGQRRNLLLNIVPGHKKFLRDDEDWPYETIEDYPIEVLNFERGVQTWFNHAPLTMAGADSIQSLAHEMLDAFANTARKQKNLFLYDPDLIEEDEIESVLHAPDLTAFPVEGWADSGGRAVMPIQFGQGQTEKNNLLDMVFGLLDRTAGTPQPGRMPAPDSATEANIIDRRVSAREDERADLFNKFQVRKAQKFWSLTTEFRPERVFLIDPRAESFIQVDEEISKGQYAFEIDITSSSTAMMLERKQWLDLLNLLSGQTQVFQMIYKQVPNLARITELLLTRGYAIQDPETILPMLEQAMQQDAILPEEAIAQLSGQQLTPETAAAAQAANNAGAQGPANAEQFNAPIPTPIGQNGSAARTSPEGQ